MSHSGDIARLKALYRQAQPRRDSDDDHNPLNVRPGVSTTSDVALLRLEAELAADGSDLKNPHIPATEAVLEEATELIRSDGHKPAWEVEA